MSTTVRLKHSSALVGGKAKVPTPSDLVNGELAVCLAEDDPSIFLKNSAGVVVKIAGAEAVGIRPEHIDGGSAVSNFGSAPPNIDGGNAAGNIF